MLGINEVELFKEGLTYSCTFFVYGVFGRISDVANAAFNVEFYYPITNLFIYSKQFIVIVAELFEGDAFGMFQKK